LDKASCGKKPPVGDPSIQRVLQRANRFGPRLLETERGGILLPLKVKGSPGGNLTKMHFHGDTLPQDQEDPKQRLTRNKSC
jgi:hypothetical protein